jgi:SNF2 family DNA or RNA helicase
MIHRPKEVILKDLPPLVNIHRYLTMEGEQLKLYEKTLKDIKIYFGNSLEDSTPVYLLIQNVLSQMMRLKQICVHPKLLEYSAGTVSQDYPSPKLELVKELLDTELEGEKVVIFTQFEKMVRIMKEELREYGITEITGSLSPEERKKMIDQFQTDPSTRVMLLTAAGGMGITLTAASTIILMDQLWNPAIMDQITARLHRIGQKNTVKAVWLWIENSIEEKIWKVLQKKSQMFKSLMEGGEAGEVLKKEDIEAWLK